MSPSSRNFYSCLCICVLTVFFFFQTDTHRDRLKIKRSYPLVCCPYTYTQPGLGWGPGTQCRSPMRAAGSGQRAAGSGRRGPKYASHCPRPPRRHISRTPESGAGSRYPSPPPESGTWVCSARQPMTVPSQAARPASRERLLITLTLLLPFPNDQLSLPLRQVKTRLFFSSKTI